MIKGSIEGISNFGFSLSGKEVLEDNSLEETFYNPDNKQTRELCIYDDKTKTITCNANVKEKILSQIDRYAR